MNALRSVRPRYDLGIISVCRSCDGYEKSVRAALKEAVAEAGLRRRVRVVGSTCLDICPKRGTTLALASRDGFGVFVLAESSDVSTALAPLLRSLSADAAGPIIGEVEPPPERPR